MTFMRELGFAPESVILKILMSRPELGALCPSGFPQNANGASEAACACAAQQPLPSGKGRTFSTDVLNLVYDPQTRVLGHE